MKLIDTASKFFSQVGHIATLTLRPTTALREAGKYEDATFTSSSPIGIVEDDWLTRRIDNSDSRLWQALTWLGRNIGDPPEFPDEPNTPAA